ncbi:MAG: hypothetical protein HGA45_36125 [Chloroflexales bacterium]|nr:hypothetical protein [Chloroflexales bacterium]
MYHRQIFLLVVIVSLALVSLVPAAAPARATVSDGPATLVTDINLTPGDAPEATAPASPKDLAAFGERLFFMAGDGTAGCPPYLRSNVNPGSFGCEPYISDGTASHTARLADTIPGPHSPVYNRSSATPPRYLSVAPLTVGQRLFFVAPAPGALWVTEGEPISTQKLYSFVDREWYYLAEKIYAAGDLVYALDTAPGLVVSDGTPAGTRPIGDFTVLSWYNGVASLGGRLYFIADDAVHGAELWVSDGTAVGTKILADINPGKPDAFTYSSALWQVGDQLVFLADDGTNGAELWGTDGTPGGTQPLMEIAPGAAGVTVEAAKVVGRQLYFITGEPGEPHQLWVSAGRRGTTAPLMTFAQYASYPSTLSEAEGRLFFATDTLTGTGATRAHLLQLWLSRDWLEAPAAVATITFPSQIIDDSVSAELLGLIGDRLMLRVDHGTGNVNSEQSWLWSVDQTSGASAQLADLPTTLQGGGLRGATVADGRLYVAGYDATGGVEPWVSDGTPAGTLRLQDINPGPASSLPSQFTRVGDQLFFSADDGQHGEELWALRGLATFPSTSVRDRFNRSDGPLGGAWRGTGRDGYQLTDQMLDVEGGGPIFWPTFFGPNQEVFVTFAHVSGGPHILLLKTQGAIDAPVSDRQSIIVEYAPGSGFSWDLRLAVCEPGVGCGTLEVWRNFVLRDGDQLGARAGDDGTVIVYRNGLEVLRGNVGPDFASKGGRIGLFTQADRNALFDNFGGGDLGSEGNLHDSVYSDTVYLPLILR